MIEADSSSDPTRRATPTPTDGIEDAKTTGLGLPPKPEMRPAWRVRTALWRRFTALFTLSFISVVAGFLIAAALGVTALLVLFVLERAIAT